MARPSRHTLSYCALCETDMVVCADCGNNCCNGGSKDVDGAKCGCQEAYEDQDAYWEDNDCVRFASDIRDKAPRTLEEMKLRFLTPRGGQSGRS